MTLNVVQDTVDALRKEECAPSFKDVQRSFSPREIPVLDPHDHEVFEVSQKGIVSVNGNMMAEYLKLKRYVSAGIGKNYWFNGMYYQEVPDDKILDEITLTAGMDPAVKMMSRNTKKDIKSEWESRGRVEDMDVPDSFYEDSRYDGWIIPFQNGLYNVLRDELVPFTPYLFFTHQLNVDYVPLQYHPVEEVYKGIIPDDETRDLFFLALGYTLYADSLVPPSIFVLLGPGETGKSALLRVMRCILGNDSVVDMNPYELSDQYAAYELVGKRANLCSEGGKRPGSKVVVDGNRIKSLVMGEPLTVNRKYKDRLTMCSTAKMWFAANNMPDFGDTSSGMLRRVHIFPCLEKQDPSAQIYDILCAPEALAYAAFRGLKAYLAFLIEGDGEFVDTEFMMKRKDNLRDSDSIMDFLSERFDNISDKEAVADALDGCVITQIYNEYRDFVSDTGRVRPAPRKDFIERITLEFKMENVKKSVRSGLETTSYKVFKKI